MPENTNQNFAFISYSHKDEKIAEWLQKKLENYRISNKIRKESGNTLPKYIRRIFRDQTDMGIEELSGSLKKRLENSQYLIVICSVNSAGSEWVNTEIEYFQKLGRAKNIIPFIVELCW